MDITSSTNVRTMISSPVADMPCGNSVGVLTCSSMNCALLCGILNSIVYDFALRARFSGLHANWFVIEESPLPDRISDVLSEHISKLASILSAHSVSFSVWKTTLPITMQSERLALTPHERLRMAVNLDTLVAVAFCLQYDELFHILHHCDVPRPNSSGFSRFDETDVKGFWRIDKGVDPEIRHTVLLLVAFQELQRDIDAAGGDREKGIDAFLAQNHGEGWMLPETLRLADYGLGHDERARHPQPVASRLGPRFYDWQLVQSADESWRECHLHARNLLGTHGYGLLLGELIERRAADGEDYFGLLTNRFTRELLGDDGYATVLLESRSRKVADERHLLDDADCTSRQRRS